LILALAIVKRGSFVTSKDAGRERVLEEFCKGSMTVKFFAIVLLLLPLVVACDCCVSNGIVVILFRVLSYLGKGFIEEVKCEIPWEEFESFFLSLV
jgi:hypothetical protein